MSYHRDLIGRLDGATLGARDPWAVSLRPLLLEAASALRIADTAAEEMGKGRIYWKRRALASEGNENPRAFAWHRNGEQVEFSLGENPPPGGGWRPLFEHLLAKAEGRANLADATSNPPESDISSLRKGAEVAVKPLDWLSDREPFFAQSPFCMYRISSVEDDTGAHWQTTIAYQGSTYKRAETEAEAKSAAQSDFETRIRSALVSGSREDNP